MKKYLYLILALGLIGPTSMTLSADQYLSNDNGAQRQNPSLRPGINSFEYDFDAGYCTTNIGSQC
jgi:hypothetical protein